MFKRNSVKALSLLAFVGLGLVACNGNGNNGGQETADGLFGTLNASYSNLVTNGILAGRRADLMTSSVLYEGLTISYTVDQSKTTFANAAATFTLGAQNLASIDGDQLVIANAEFDRDNPYCAFTASVTIDDEVYTRDYLVMVIPNDLDDIADITSMTSGATVNFVGYWMGTNGVLSEQFRDYNAAFVAVGDDAMMLYQLDGAFVTDDLVVGDTLVQVTGTYSPYNGLPEVKVTDFVAIDPDDSYAKPVDVVLNAENNDYELVEADINRRFKIEGATVTDKTVDSQFGNITIDFTVGGGETEYTIYLDSRYNDLEGNNISDLQVGDTFSTYTWLSYNSGSYRFNYLEDFSFQHNEVTEVTVSIAGRNYDIYTADRFNSLSFTADVTLPADKTDATVTWSSSNSKVATVDAQGHVTGLTAGEATITATSNADKTKTDTIKVTVKAAPAVQTIDEAKAALRAAHETADKSKTDIAFTGKVSYVVNSKYGNLYVTDENGDGMYVYGTENYSAAGVEQGDMVTVMGPAVLDSSYGLEMMDVLIAVDEDAADITVSPKVINSTTDFAALDFVSAGDFLRINNVTKIDLSGDRAILTLTDGQTINTSSYSDSKEFEKLPTLGAGQTYTLDCYVTCFNAKPQVKDIVSITANPAA